MGREWQIAIRSATANKDRKIWTVLSHVRQY